MEKTIGIEKAAIHWRLRALDYLGIVGSFPPISEIDSFREKCVLALGEQAGCDQIHLTKLLDGNSEVVFVSSSPELKGAFVDTSFLRKESGEDFFYHEKITLPNRFHFLKDAHSIVYIPLNEVHYKGAILLVFKQFFNLEDGFQVFLSLCLTRIREVMRLNATNLALEDLSVRFTTVFHTVSQALVFTDDSGKNAWLNSQAKELLQLSDTEEEEIRPILVSEAMKNLRERAENVEEILKDAVLLFQQPDRELRGGLWKYPTKVYRVESIPTISKRIKGRLWVFEDISQMYFANRQLNWFNEELKQVNEELKTTLTQVYDQNNVILSQNEEIKLKNETLESINLEKDGLISIVSHDLRTPMLQIKGFTNLISTENLSNEQKFCLEMIQKVAERGLSLIKDLLDLNAIEHQKSNKKPEMLDVHETLVNTLELFKIVAEKKNISLHISTRSPLAMIWADMGYFHRITDNLVSNAIKFSHPNTAVHVTSEVEAEKVVIYIKDEGQGIKQEDMKHLFGKFKRLSARPTGDEHSTGLGLSIVKALVEELTGDIRCESEWGKGTTFILEFPLYRP